MALVLVSASVFAAVMVGAATVGGGDNTGSTAGERRFEGATLPRGVEAPRFRLRDQDGDQVAMEDLRGRPVIVTFLYTHCEDSCPTQAQQVRSALDELGEDVPALAIAVEPERDTEESARAFLSEQRVLGRMQFLLGSRDELKRVWEGFGVTPQRDDLEHSGRFVLVDPKGVQRVSFPIDQATPERLAHDLRLLADGA
jgi:protein SCO1/2